MSVRGKIHVFGLDFPLFIIGLYAVAERREKITFDLFRFNTFRIFWRSGRKAGNTREHESLNK